MVHCTWQCTNSAGAMYKELVISGKGLKNLWNTDARKVGSLVHCQPPRAKVGTLYIAQCTNFGNLPTGFGTLQCTMYRINIPAPVNVRSLWGSGFVHTRAICLPFAHRPDISPLVQKQVQRNGSCGAPARHPPLSSRTGCARILAAHLPHIHPVS